MKKTNVAKDPYLEKCKEIMQTYPEEIRRIFHYPDCELEYDFLGFLENYEVELPKGFTVIDLGCYMGIQSVYFKDQQQYIGVDVATPTIWRMIATDNVAYYQCTIQNFIRDILPHLNLDLNKSFAICSYVPDEEARAMMRETFPYYRDVYGNEMQEKLPVIHKTTNAIKETPNITQKTEEERYMEDIELIIKIPKDLYKAYKGRPPMLGDAGMDMITQAIANGVPVIKDFDSKVQEPEQEEQEL